MTRKDHQKLSSSSPEMEGDGGTRQSTILSVCVNVTSDLKLVHIFTVDAFPVATLSLLAFSASGVL